MTMGKRNLLRAALFVFIFAAFGVISNLPLSAPLRLTPAITFCSLTIAWTVSVHSRVVSREIRRYLILLGIFMLIWLVEREFKFRYALSFSQASQRFLWYIYYIPMLIMPLMCLFAALCAGKPDSWRLPRPWLLLYIPALTLIGFVLTNDMHQAAFRFAPGFEGWVTEYSHGVIYYLAAVWIAACLIASVILTLRQQALSARRRNLWMPLAAPAAMLIYTALYMTPLGIISNYIRVVEMFCFMIIGFWEGSIQSGLIISNTGYDVMFSRSRLSAQICGSEGKAVYKTSEFPPPPGAVIIRHRHPIQGGYMTWAEDISKITALQAELEDANERLSGEAALLEAENALLAEKSQLAEQSRLYAAIASGVAAETERISQLVDGAERDPDKLIANMRLACFLTVYIKRRANLMLLARKSSAITLSELMLAIAESADYLTRMGVSCSVSRGTDAELSAESVIAAYDGFFRIADAALSSLTAIKVEAGRRGNDIYMDISVDNPALSAPLPSGGFITERCTDKDMTRYRFIWNGGGEK